MKIKDIIGRYYRESSIMAENIELTVQGRAENELLNDAIAYAATMHRNGLRKGTCLTSCIRWR